MIDKEYQEFLLNDEMVKVQLNIKQNKFISDVDRDQWIDALFSKDERDLPVRFECSFDHIDDSLIDPIRIMLRFARVLMLQSKMPVYEDISVISISNSLDLGNSIELSLNVQKIANLPLQIYKKVFFLTANVTDWITNNKPTRSNRDQIYKIIEKDGLIKFKTMVPGGKSTVPTLSVANKLGIPIYHLGSGVYQLGWGSKLVRFDRSSSEFDSAIGAKLSQNKYITTNILRESGFPSATHRLATSEEEALESAKFLGYPLVVKPLDGDRGEGVTVDVFSEELVRQGFHYAIKFTKRKIALIEKQVDGVCHRIFIANGKLLYAVKRLPMSVYADGIRSVQQMVTDQFELQQSKPPWNRSEIKKLDNEAHKELHRQGLHDYSIPPKGTLVTLRRIESTAEGGIDEDVTSIIHSENVNLAQDATKLFGLNVCGVDIITNDISKPWHSNGAIINEVNYSPLLGGADISRSYIATYLARFIDGNGKIPINIFTSGEKAENYFNEKLNEGLRYYFITDGLVLNHDRNVIRMNFKDIKSELRALLRRLDVDGVVILYIKC